MEKKRPCPALLPYKSFKLTRVGKIDDAVVEAILTEVPVKGENGIEPFGLDQGKGCAVGETEILIGMPQEDAFRFGLCGRSDAKDDNPGGLEGTQELRGMAMARAGPDQCARLIHDVIRSVKLGADGFEAGADVTGGGMERVVAIHDSEEAPAVNEHPHEAGFFQV
jgi:hypothetical protein